MRTTSRSSKTIIILLAAIVGLLWHGTRVQRRMVRRLTSFGMFYPGEDQVSAIGGWFGGVGGAVKDMVTRMIRATADALQSGIDWVLSVAQHAAGFAWDLFNLAKDYAWGIVAELRNYVVSLYWQAVDFAQRAAGAVRDFASWVYNAVHDLAVSLYWQAVDFAQRAAGAVRDFASWVWNAAHDLAVSLYWQAVDLAQRVAGAVKDFAVSAFHAALDFASSVLHQALDYAHTFGSWVLDTAIDMAHKIVDQVHTVIDNSIDFVKNELGDAISTVNDYLFSTVQTIIDAVITVIDWIIALAEFPFTTARDLWAAMRNTGGGTIRDHMPGMVDRWSDHIGAHAVANSLARDKGYQLAALPGHDYGLGGGVGTGGAVGPGVGTPDRVTFATALLAALGAPTSASNMAFLIAWMTHENTRATYNPLATTLDFGQNTRFNSVGVRNYADLATGVEATARTIIGSGYPTILAALRAGDGHAAGQAHADLSRWSGGGYDTIAA